MNPEASPENENKPNDPVVPNDASPQPETQSTEPMQPNQPEVVDQSGGINASKPDINMPSGPNMPKLNTFSASNSASSQATTTTSQTSEPKPKKSKKILFVILLAIIVASALGAVAFFAMKEPDGSSDKTAEGIVQLEADMGSELENDSQTEEEIGGDNELSKKDTQLKQTVTTMMSALVEYLANNNGKVPTLAEASTALAPYGQNLSIVDDTPKENQVQYMPSAKCAEDGSIVEGTARQLVLRALLSDGSFYCVE